MIRRRKPAGKDGQGLVGPPEATAPPLPRARRLRSRRFLGYSSKTVLALIAAALLVSLVFALFEGSPSSSSPGDPSSAGVVDSDVFWSPDSRSIAFDRREYGAPDDTKPGASDVYVASADGRELRRLTRTPRSETVQGWLSDPPRIVYSRIERPKGPTIVYALDVSGGTPAKLGEVRATDKLLALSHDARRALVGTPRLDPERYALVDLVANTRRSLPGRSAPYRTEGTWSPDDSMLAYATDTGIVILRGDRVLWRISDSGSDLAWSPDGRRLAYAVGFDYGSLWLVRIGDGGRSRLTGSGETLDDAPVWSPDGSTIYYAHGSFGDHDGLRAIAPDGTGDRLVTQDDWGGSFFSGSNGRWLEEARISPDGTRIAYLVGEAACEGGDCKTWSLAGVMDADGSGKTPFPGSF